MQSPGAEIMMRQEKLRKKLRKKLEKKKDKMKLDPEHLTKKDEKNLNALYNKGLTPEEKEYLENFSKGKLEEYQRINEINQSENIRITNIMTTALDEADKLRQERDSLKDINEKIVVKHQALQELLAADDKDRKLAEEVIKYEGLYVVTNKKFEAMMTLNRTLKQDNDELQETIMLQDRYCDAVRLMSNCNDKHPVWDAEVCARVAAKYNDQYQYLYLEALKDINASVDITWQVDKGEITAVEGIDKIHKIFVKSEGVITQKGFTEKEFKALAYEQMKLSDKDTKKFMLDTLARMEKKLKIMKESSPDLEKHYNEVLELQAKMYDPANYVEETEPKEEVKDVETGNTDLAKID